MQGLLTHNGSLTILAGMDRSPVNTSDNPVSRQTLCTGGIVLCGGKSSRMGQPKLSLIFDGELMLLRVVRILSEVVRPIVVVAAPGQEVPDLPEGTLLTRDDRAEEGPLRGLVCGLESLAGRVEAAYVSSCDVPLLRPEFVRRMVASLEGYDIVVPVEEGFVHPLAGVYRVAVAPQAREILDRGGRRPLALIETCSTWQIDVEELREVDSRLDSLRNLNTPEDFEAARRLDRNA